MEITIVPPATELPMDRGYVVSIVINSFKGRRDVEVHLFRSSYEISEESAYDWDKLIEDSHHPDVEYNPAAARQFVMETFTEEERDQVLEFLKEKYRSKVSRVDSTTISFPVPMGIAPLSSIPEGKTMGFIRFDTLPSFNLPFHFRGFYDLAQHEPLTQE